jgi:hypothetical protein
VANGRTRFAKEKRHPGGFVAFPHAVIRSGQFASLSPHAVKLLVDLLAQYQGSNNGDLCATWSMMAARGWRSRDTLWKALKELVEKGWIVQTRQGGMNAASLYGVTFFAFDPSPKLEITAKAFPRGAWYQVAPIARPEKRNGEHARRANSEPTNTGAVSTDKPAPCNQPAGRVVEEALSE